MYSSESHSSTDKLNSVAVLAAWCDTPNHLGSPAVEEYLEEPEHREICNLIGESWDPCGPAGPGIQLEASSRRPGRAACPACGRLPCCSSSCQCLAHQAGPAELSQRCVDVLLREYYKMVVAAQQHTAHSSSSGSSGANRPGAAARLFLALCPNLPWPCRLDTTAAAVAAVYRSLVTVTVLLCWVLVPAWLLLLRHELGLGHWQDVVLLVLGGLLWLLLAGERYQAAATARAAADKGRVTAGQLQDVIPPAGSPLLGQEAFLVPQPSTCLPVLRSPPEAPNGTHHSSVAPGGNSSAPGTPTRAAGRQAAARAAAAAAVVDGTRYLSAMAEVQLLQRTVWGPGGVRQGSGWPVDVIVQEVLKLCSTIGLPWKPPAGGQPSPDQLHQVLKDLKKHLGI